MKYRYAQEKITTAAYILSHLGEGTDAPERVAGAISEIEYAENDISNDSEAKRLYDEIISLIDYSKLDQAKGVLRKNIEEMNKELQMYVVELIWKLHFRIEDLWYKTHKIEKEEDPNVKTWKQNIRKTREQFREEMRKKSKEDG